jgi:hypothetical protein
MPEPVDWRSWIDTGAVGRGLDDVVDGAVGEQMACPTAPGRTRELMQSVHSGPAIAVGISTCRTLSPLPTTSSCASPLSQRIT